MKTRLSKRSVVLAVGVLAFLGALLALGRPWEVPVHDTYRAQLLVLRARSAELEQDILRARMGLPEVRGTSPEEFAALREYATELRTFPEQLPVDRRQALSSALEDYLRALDEIEAQLARARTEGASPEAQRSALQALLDLSLHAKADQLSARYLSLDEAGQVQAAQARIVLFAMALLLMGFVVLMLVRLGHTSAELEALNAQLEHRVEQRTAELSAANSELRDSEARKAAILESSLDGIISLDSTGAIQEFNPAAERIFRLPRAQALGRDFRTLALAASVTPAQREVVESALKADTRPGRATRLELTALRADGSPFPSEFTLLRVRGDGPPLFTAYVHDITERKEVERMKSEFVSTVSHELRTPLTSIRGSLGLLEGGVVGEVSGPVLDMVRIARTNSERLIRLINDILDLEKMESGKLELRAQPVEVDEVVEATFSGVRGMVDASNVELRAEVGGTGQVRADRDRLIQVLTNLVSNAIKFSPAQGVVTVRAAREARGQVRFEVVDQGPGIPWEKRAKLFGKFQQLDSSDTRSKGGTGLGLAISQAIIEQHGSRIEVQSEPGQGATFTFSLPVVKVDSGSLSMVRDESRYNILVVTADMELSSLMRGLLTAEGYRVLRAGSQQEAENHLEMAIPDVVVVEAQLPDGEGLALVRRLREEPSTRELPVVMLAERLPPERGGFPRVDWMARPFDETHFLQALRFAIREPGQARALVVDADPDMRRLLRHQLERLGVACHEAEDGESAVAQARETKPDLIVMDVALPRLDGFEVVDILRQGKGRGTPLIVHTGRVLSHDDVRQLTLGITRSVPKARASEEQVVGSARELLSGLLAQGEGKHEARKAIS